MSIINRYIFRESAVYFAISLFAFTGILLTLRMIKFASLIVNRGVSFGQIGMVSLSMIPTFLEIAIPLSTLLGLMLAFGRLSGDSEIIVMRSSGISIFSMIRPVVLFGALSALLTLYVSLYLSPWGFQKLSSTLFEIARTSSLAGMDPGVFNKLGQMTIYADRIDYETGQMQNILVDDKRSVHGRKIISGRTGALRSSESEQSITIDLEDGDIHEIIEGRYVLTHYNTNRLLVDSRELFDPAGARKGKSPREMRLGELLAEIDERRAELALHVPEPDQEEKTQVKDGETGTTLAFDTPLLKFNRLRTEAGRRLSIPYASLILALIALPLGVQVPRSQKTWGAGLSACLGMLVFVIYYALLSIGVALAESGHLNPYVGLWLPNLAATLFSLYAVWKVASEKWQSVPSAMEIGINRFWERVSTYGVS